MTTPQLGGIVMLLLPRFPPHSHHGLLDESGVKCGNCRRPRTALVRGTFHNGLLLSWNRKPLFTERLPGNRAALPLKSLKFSINQKV